MRCQSSARRRALACSEYIKIWLLELRLFEALGCRRTRLNPFPRPGASFLLIPDSWQPIV